MTGTTGSDGTGPSGAGDGTGPTGAPAGHARVAVVGLGLMGVPLVLRLAEQGLSVLAASRGEASRRACTERAAQAGVADRVRVVGTVDDLALVLSASPVDAVLLSLPSGPQVLDVLGRLLARPAVAAAPPLVCDLSTTTPEDARRAAALLPPGGFVDAPVSGGPAGARTGTLSVMAGGEPRALDVAERVLGPVAALVTRCGPVGSGQVAKACNQLLVTTGIAAVAEALTLAAAAGADPAAVRRALLGGWAASRVLDVHGLRMLQDDFVPGGRARHHAKDVAVVRTLAAEGGLAAALPVFEAAGRQIERLAAADPDGDHSGVVRLVRADRTERTTGPPPA